MEWCSIVGGEHKLALAVSLYCGLSIVVMKSHIIVGDGGAIQDYLRSKTGSRTVPQVFIGGKFIGGGSETKALHDQKKLVPMLKDCGAL